MYLESEIISKKGWGHSSVEQGIDFANQINVKNFLISHHSPLRERYRKLKNYKQI